MSAPESTSPSRTELLPCPFCGSEEIHFHGRDDVHWAKCHGPDDCDAESASFETRAEVVAAWNRRATPAPAAPGTKNVRLVLDGSTDLTARYVEADEAPFPRLLGTVYVARAHLPAGAPPEEIEVAIRVAPGTDERSVERDVFMAGYEVGASLSTLLGADTAWAMFDAGRRAALHTPSSEPEGGQTV